MMRVYSVRLATIAAVGIMAGSRVIAGGATGLAGTWRGESICVSDASACRNESVAYHFKDVPNRSDVVLIQADKIVDGKAITMGTGQWQYDRVRQTLEWRMPQRVWLLNVIGTRIEGTLRLADGTLFRKMTLHKDQSEQHDQF